MGTSTSAPMTPDQFAGTGPAPGTAPQPMSPDEFANKQGPGQPVVQPGQTTGYLPNIAAGLGEAGSFLINAVHDPYANLVARPLLTAGFALHDLFAPVFGGQQSTPEQRADVAADFANQPGQAFVRNAAHGAGLPAPEEVAPATTGEGLARAATTGAALLPIMGPGVGLRAGATEAAVGGLSATTGQAFADVVPDQWKDVANTAGQFGGMLLVPAARGVYRAGSGMVRTAAGAAVPGEAVPIVDPATGQPFQKPGQPGAPYTATDAQAAIAGRKLAAAGGTTPADMATAPPPAENVPGSTLTWGQETGNPAILSAERKLRNTPGAAVQFNAQEATNDLARIQHVENVTPQVAADTASQWALSKLQQMQTAEEASNNLNQTGAHVALEQSGAGVGLPSTEEIGAGQREQLEGLRVTAKDNASAALDAIDPNNDLALDASPVGQTARDIRANDVGEGELQHPAAERVLDAAAGVNGVVTFQRLRKMMSTTTAAMRQVARNAEYGTESPSYRRLTQVLQSIHGSIADAAGRAAEREAAAGGEPPTGGIIDRFGKVDEGGQAPAASGQGPAVAGEIPSGGAAGAAGIAGAEAAGNGEAVAGVAGNRPVAPVEPAGGVGAGAARAGQPATETAAQVGGRARRPESLLEYLISKGGIKGNADLTAMGANEYHHRGGGRLINNKSGMAVDREARENLIGEGFLNQGADVNDVQEAIRTELGGKRLYRQGDQAAGEYHDARAAEQRINDALMAKHRNIVQLAEMELGARMSDAELEHAAELSRDGLHPHEAVMQAMLPGETRALQNNTQRSGLNIRPGVAPESFQSEMPSGGGSTLTENMTPEARAQQRAANKDYADYKARFRAGAVGDVLRRGPIADKFKITDVRVPGALWGKGVAGADAADSLIKAAGSPDAAARILGDAPYLSFRNTVAPDGVVNSRAAATWLSQHAPILDKFPEIRDRLSNPVRAQQAVEEAAIRGQKRIDEFQDSAAQLYLGRNLGGTDPQVAMERLVGHENPGAAARDLMRQTAGNDAATDGIRRNFIDWFTGKGTSTREIGQTGENVYSNAGFQRLLQNPKVMAAARAILKPEQLKALQDTAKDMQEAQRIHNATRIPGSPGSAMDLEELGHGQHGNVFFQIALADRLSEFTTSMLGKTFGFAGELAALVGAKMFLARRAAGMATVNDLMVGAVLNPALRRVLAQKAIANPRSPLMAHTMRRLVTLATGVPAQTQGQEQ